MVYGRRAAYLRERAEVGKLSLPKLQQLLAYLGKRRYEENDISVENAFRIASSVYIQKTKSGGSFRFHLRNFIGALLVSAIMGIFIVYK
jgi:hypothetical protein